ncbi:hypothetical protein MKX03_028171 [Papaver bracteatum]|nr:hypothetical protein MKX03_028171 [Papaver bracteatum]
MKNQRNHNFLLIFLFLLPFSTHVTVFAADRISSGESLTRNQTIISRGGNFELGFFKPGKSQNHYIGIWYKKLSDAPILDPSNSKLTLLGNGNLVITNRTEKSPPIWSTNYLNATEAVLGDAGNLVLRDGGSNPSVVIWQSFDYLTDTWLPGGRIGFNKNTKKTWLLTSWRNREDPALGIFTLELNPNGTRQTLIRWNKSVQVWTTGKWNKSYPLVPPKMTGNGIMIESFISNVNESYLTYTLFDSSSLTRLVMDVSGQIKQYTWLDIMKKDSLFWYLPEQFCDVYGICGPFGNCNQDTMKCDCLPGFVNDLFQIGISRIQLLGIFLCSVGRKMGFRQCQPRICQTIPILHKSIASKTAKWLLKVHVLAMLMLTETLSVNYGMEIC